MEKTHKHIHGTDNTHWAQVCFVLSFVVCLSCSSPTERDWETCLIPTFCRSTYPAETDASSVLGSICASDCDLGVRSDWSLRWIHCRNDQTWRSHRRQWEILNLTAAETHLKLHLSEKRLEDWWHVRSISRTAYYPTASIDLSCGYLRSLDQSLIFCLTMDNQSKTGINLFYLHQDKMHLKAGGLVIHFSTLAGCNISSNALRGLMSTLHNYFRRTIDSQCKEVWSFMYFTCMHRSV